jgi:hypothetical protein
MDLHSVKNKRFGGGNRCATTRGITGGRNKPGHGHANALSVDLYF